MTKHRLTKSKTYAVWTAMKQRCYNPKETNYKWYGARGIQVCAKWKNSFLSFLADMGEVPKNKQLDRINNNRNYSPKNCKWSSPIQNSNNKRNNKKFKIDGVWKTAPEWARVSGLPLTTVRARIRKGVRGKKIIHPPHRIRKMRPLPCGRLT